MSYLDILNQNSPNQPPSEYSKLRDHAKNIIRFFSCAILACKPICQSAGALPGQSRAAQVDHGYHGSDVLDASDRGPFHFCPVDAVVELLVHQADGAHAITAHQVQPQGHLDGRLRVVGLADDSLDGVVEHLQKAIMR